MPLKHFRITAGFPIAGEAVEKLMTQGMPTDISTAPVMFHIVHTTLNSTVFEVEAETIELATEWARALAQAIPQIEEFTPPVIENPDPPPPPLDVWARVGTWTKTVGEADTVIGTFPGNPLGLIVWGSGQAGATIGGSPINHCTSCIGFTDGANQYSIASLIQDNLTTSNANRVMGGGSVFQVLDPTGSNSATIIKESAWGGVPTYGSAVNTFTLHWDATTLATQGFYFVFGGTDIKQVAAKEFYTTSNNTPGTEDFSSQLNLWFRPDFAMVIDPFMPWGGPPPPNSFLSNALPPIRNGISVHASNTLSKTWGIARTAKDNTTATDSFLCQGLQSTNTPYGDMLLQTLSTSESRLHGAAFTGWTSKGFKINWIDPPDEPYHIMAGLFVQGGHWDAGKLDQPHPTGSIVNPLWHERSVPKAVMGFSINQASNALMQAYPGGDFVIGGQDSAGNKACLSTSALNATSPTVTASHMVSDKFMKHITADAVAADSVLNAEAVISDMSTLAQFTVNYTTTSAINREVVWFSLSS